MENGSCVACHRRPCVGCNGDDGGKHASPTSTVAMPTATQPAPTATEPERTATRPPSTATMPERTATPPPATATEPERTATPEPPTVTRTVGSPTATPTEPLLGGGPDCSGDTCEHDHTELVAIAHSNTNPGMIVYRVTVQDRDGNELSTGTDWGDGVNGFSIG
jgi:hypothetical protein